MRNREKRLSTYVPQDRQPIPEPQTEEKQQQPSQRRRPEESPEPDEEQ
jgi:hypothetical protein